MTWRYPSDIFMMYPTMTVSAAQVATPGAGRRNSWQGAIRPELATKVCRGGGRRDSGKAAAREDAEGWAAAANAFTALGKPLFFGPACTGTSPAPTSSLFPGFKPPRLVSASRRTPRGEVSVSPAATPDPACAAQSSGKTVGRGPSLGSATRGGGSVEPASERARAWSATPGTPDEAQSPEPTVGARPASSSRMGRSPVDEASEEEVDALPGQRCGSAASGRGARSIGLVVYVPGPLPVSSTVAFPGSPCGSTSLPASPGAAGPVAPSPSGSPGGGMSGSPAAQARARSNWTSAPATAPAQSAPPSGLLWRSGPKTSNRKPISRDRGLRELSFSDLREQPEKAHSARPRAMRPARVPNNKFPVSRLLRMRTFGHGS